MPNRHLVLYADDDIDDILLLRDAFADYSKQIKLVTVGDGVSVLDYLAQLKDKELPCLIILDINMPRLNGKETLRELREIPRYQNVPVILFTTSIQLHDENYARQYGAGFITKPLNITQLNKIVDVFVDHCADQVKKQIREI